MGCSLVDDEPETLIIQPRAVQDCRQFPDIVDHALILILAARFGSSCGEKNSFRPLLDLATLANAVPVGCP